MNWIVPVAVCVVCTFVVLCCLRVGAQCDRELEEYERKRLLEDRLGEASGEGKDA